MKILIINHSTNYIYGASKSLQLLLNNLDCEYDMIVPKALTRNFNENELRKVFGNRIGFAKAEWLPFVPYYKGRNSIKLRGRIYLAIQNIFFKITRKRLEKKYFNNRNYDFIYLNSMVLFPLINEKQKFIIHIREVFQGSQIEYSKVKEKLLLSSGVVFIDQATLIPFEKLHFNNKTVLPNPFNMEKVSDINKKNVMKYFNIVEGSVVFSILGLIIADRGVDVVINAFKKIRNDNAVLLIVGSKNKGNYKYCKYLAKGDNRIRFIGEYKNTDFVYRISDYIIRGDNTVALGRTIFEGLFASCDVIVPMLKEGDSVNELTRFASKIHTYTLNDENSLFKVMNILANVRVTKESYCSNVHQYNKEFMKFVDKSLRRNT